MATYLQIKARITFLIGLQFFSPVVFYTISQPNLPNSVAPNSLGRSVSIVSLSIPGLNDFDPPKDDKEPKTGGSGGSRCH